MAGIELYAPRAPRHRRTWTAAALILAVVFIVLGQAMTAVPGLMLGFIAMSGQSVGWTGTAFSLFSFAATALIVVGWVSLFERRNLLTIGFNGKGLIRFVRGYGVGLAFLLVVVGGIAALGGYRIEAGGVFSTPAPLAALWPILVLLLGFVIQGSTEEILTRGWLMQVIASRHGLAWGIGLSSVLFGLLHAANIRPSPELAVGVANVVLFGVMIGLYAAREGSLWGVCGWHAAWNWLLGLGFGLEVSGQAIETKPLIVDLATRSEVPWWTTGAAFGPEGSIVTTAVLLTASVVLALRWRSKDYGVTEPAASSLSKTTPI
ncbi:CPBP family intramembrane glutamic endopeptidase [Brevundimonas sp. SORGH_AS_0993]|uniref:CPBP family intramembrane glutamic endopeptidase n=1 Tax=Brevundimonas sp. SORGH_AS_0993 TaxID=3041794 RepID=UPI00277D829F|nr:type II CAAX endopeptidase family protein [Brevundimonas sp. SORGH_AS_0993]MDQ1153370.1 membrane protease YdiL (CAAX protease family) [Brevundimonas sp. SORGH_AS_0993]